MASGIYVPANEGEAFWFLGNLMTVKAGAAETNGGFTLIEAISPAGFAPPPHVHRDEDEAFYVLEGEMSVTCGADHWVVGPGGFVMLPRGIAHSFSVSERGPLKMLQLSLPSQFERFVAEFGEPARERVLPAPSEPDIARLIDVMGNYGIEIAGPPTA